MITRLVRGIDGFSALLDRVARAVVVLLVASMVYEVGARYAFGAPTMWAFDLSYMATGVLFILGAGHAVRNDVHIRIDFLACRMPPRLRYGVDGALYLLGLAPLFAALTTVAAERALRAFATGEVETVSPWAPLMWPFYALLAVGLGGLTMQVAIEGGRALARAAGANSSRGV